MPSREDREDAYFIQSLLHKHATGEVLPPFEDIDTAKPLPRLTLRSVPRYIATVAERVADGSLSPKQASALLYAVQVFVGAHKVLGAKGVRQLQAVAEEAGGYPSPPCQPNEGEARKGA